MVAVLVAPVAAATSPVANTAAVTATPTAVAASQRWPVRRGCGSFVFIVYGFIALPLVSWACPQAAAKPGRHTSGGSPTCAGPGTSERLDDYLSAEPASSPR